MDLKLIL